MSCPSHSLCVAVDDKGQALTFTPPTRDRVTAWLTGELAPPNGGPRLGTLLRRKKFVMPFSSLSQGRVAVRWMYKNATVAAGSVGFDNAGVATVTLRLRHSAIKKLRGLKSAELTATATLSTGLVKASRTITLKH